jgi:hypothetical protein
MNYTHIGHAEWQATIGRRRVRPVHERAVEAEAKAAQFLADANEARDAGKNAKADCLYSAAQKWLDEFNRLTDRA